RNARAPGRRRIPRRPGQGCGAGFPDAPAKDDAVRVNGIPILDKVRKLLAKAEDPACTPAEAEAFTAKAAELIAKYGVDAALLAESDPQRDPVGDRVIDIPAPYATEKCTLLSEVATELRCRAVRRLRRGSAGKEFSMHLFGHAADLERVEVLFTSLLVQ